MLSIKATYENGKIRLLEPITINENSDVILTFLDGDFSFSENNISGAGLSSQAAFLDSKVPLKEDQPEEFFEQLREHKRYKAKGDITLVMEGQEITYPLNDYSAGGLSFTSDQVFQVSQTIMANLKYKLDDDILVMDFELVIRGVFEEKDKKYKVGCQFLDQIDEQLWHTIMS